MLNIHWNEFETPYKNAANELQEQIDYLLGGSMDPDEIDQFLYNELAPNIKHNYRVYNVVNPVMLCVEEHLESDPPSNIRLSLFNFLEYIFSEQIRDCSRILYTPTYYHLSDRRKTLSSNDEINSFENFRHFYVNNYRDYFHHDQNGLACFYDAIFMPEEKTAERFASCLNDPEVLQPYRFDALLGLGYLRYFYPEVMRGISINQTNITGDTYADIPAAINLLPHDANRLLTHISSPAITPSSWGNGYAAVLAACSYYLYCMNDSTEGRTTALENIFESYVQLKSNCNQSEEELLEFPVYHYLLEDITSIVFNNFLGSGRVIRPEDLDEIQQFTFHLLADKYKIHTYAMLFAGLPPAGIEIDAVDKIENIYSCYA